MVKLLILAALIALVLIVFSGCAARDGLREGYDAGSFTPNVSADNVDPWPLTVPEARVECEPVKDTNLSRAFVRVGKTRYTLNGHAKSAHPDLPNVAEIWKDNPDRPGQKVPIDALIKVALDTCKP